MVRHPEKVKITNIYLCIYILTYIAPLQGNYSEALPAQAKEDS